MTASTLGVRGLADLRLNAGELTIIRRIVRTGELDAKVCAIRDGAATVWTRREGEFVGELLERATREADRTASGVARLIEYTEESHAEH